MTVPEQAVGWRDEAQAAAKKEFLRRYTVQGLFGFPAAVNAALDVAERSIPAAPQSLVGVERRGADTVALEATRKIEAFFAEQHPGGIVQRRAKIQCAIIDAIRTLPVQSGSEWQQLLEVVTTDKNLSSLRARLDRIDGSEAYRMLPEIWPSIKAILALSDFAALSPAAPASPQPETDAECERRLLDEEAAENLRLIDWIADKIGLPKNEELSRENFSQWLSGPASPQPLAEPVHERETPVVKPIGQEGSSNV